MLPYLQGAYTYGSTCKDEVARLEHEELAHIGHQLIYPEEHIHGVPALHRLAVNIKMEAYVLHVGKALYRNELAQHRRAVKSLAKLPRQPLLAEALLHVTRRDVHTHRHRIIVAMSKSRSDVLTQLADAHHQFGLIVESLGKVGDEEGLAPLLDGRVGFHKYDGALGLHRCAAIQFLIMFGIVHAYADNFHEFESL